MVRECLECGADNEISAAHCSTCGNQFEPLMAGGDAELKAWAIICPVCGKFYPVDNEKERINSCIVCTDEFDKTEIARVVPKLSQTKKNQPDARPDNDLIPQPSQGIQPITLHAIRHHKRIHISEETVLGRSGDVENEFFAEFLHVSREHCRIFHSEGQWMIEHLSHSSPTAINGSQLVHDIPVAVHPGDRLRIANLSFKVAIETPGTIFEKAD